MSFINFSALLATSGVNISTGNSIITIAAILVIAVIILVISNIKIVPQAYSYVIERFGGYHDTWTVGLHVKVPFIDRISKRVNLKEQVVDFPPQPVITKDNVRMQIDTVVFYQITDCKLFAYGHSNPMTAIENLTSTTLRNIIGELELDSTLTSRDIINTKMRSILDEATDPWGIKVTRVELKNIIPPKEIQDAMEKQMKAERERRESILRAEGERNSAILVAEGRKQSMILEAEANKQAAILNAEAVKEAKVQEAEGEAEAKEIRNDADKSVSITLSEANARAEVIMAEGEAEYMRILSEVYDTADEADFYEFMRALDMARNSLGGENNTLVISSDSPIASILNGNY